MTDRDPIAAALEDLRKKETAKREQSERVIDTRTFPRNALDVLRHHTLGQLYWDESRAVAAAKIPTLENNWVSTDSFDQKLVESGQQPLNATVLDWLMEHQESIPDAWRDGNKRLFFGTVFVADRIAYMRYDLKEQRWTRGFLSGGWGQDMTEQGIPLVLHP